MLADVSPRPLSKQLTLAWEAAEEIATPIGPKETPILNFRMFADFERKAAGKRMVGDLLEVNRAQPR
jgi:hypothetical protein